MITPSHAKEQAVYYANVNGTANDKQIERAKLSDSNKFVSRREEERYIRKNIININKNWNETKIYLD